MRITVSFKYTTSQGEEKTYHKVHDADSTADAVRLSVEEAKQKGFTIQNPNKIGVHSTINAAATIL